MREKEHGLDAQSRHFDAKAWKTKAVTSLLGVSSHSFFLSYLNSIEPRDHSAQMLPANLLFKSCFIDIHGVSHWCAMLRNSFADLNATSINVNQFWFWYVITSWERESQNSKVQYKSHFYWIYSKRAKAKYGCSAIIHSIKFSWIRSTFQANIVFGLVWLFSSIFGSRCKSNCHCPRISRRLIMFSTLCK